MLKITMNFQILLFLGAVIFFAAGIINSKSKSHFLLTTLFIVLFFNTFFILIVLKELPILWYFVPVYITSALLGVLYRKYKQRIIASSALLIAVILFLAVQIIPDSLESSLSKERFDKLPEFSMQDINGNKIDTKNLKGKIVVLDFFGTWCKPCILELKELDIIKTLLMKMKLCSILSTQIREMILLKNLKHSLIRIIIHSILYTTTTAKYSSS